MTAVWGGSSLLQRLRRAAASRVGQRLSDAPRARVDTCWLLTDGSLCVDGWVVERDGLPGPVAARVVQRDGSRPWSPLLRKERPDVAEHVLGAGPVSSAFGIVGQVAGPVDSALPLVVEVRAEGGSVRLPIADVRHDAVPEETFAGLVVTGTPTPASLAAVVGVVRASAVPSAPAVSLGYRHDRMTGSAAVGVVVPVYRDHTYLRNLLRALADGHDGVELTVVCDDPQLADELVAWVRAWNEVVYDVPMQVLVHDRNAGFAAACNTGWRSCSGELVVLLNSDVLVADPSRDLARLAAGMAVDVAAIAPVLLFPDGSLQHAGMAMVDAPDFPGFVLPGHPGKHGPADDLPDEVFDVPMLTGAAICVRRTVLEQVGGVPAVYGRGDFEDVLLSLSLRDFGRLVVDPGARWTHVEGASYRRAELGGIAVTLAKSVVVAERTGGRR